MGPAGNGSYRVFMGVSRLQGWGRKGEVIKLASARACMEALVPR